jgi:anti-sigma B factor antagonist
MRTKSDFLGGSVPRIDFSLNIRSISIGGCMNIETVHVGDVTVIHIIGSLSGLENSEILQGVFENLFKQNHLKIVLNLAQTPYIDAFGLGTIVRGYTVVSRLRGRMVFTSLTTRIQGLLQITKLHSIFEIYQDETLAVRSFAS